MESQNAPYRPRRRQKATRETFVSLSLRQAWADRQQDLIDQYAAEVAVQIGTADIGAARRALVRRAATIALEAERLESRFSSGEEMAPDDLAAYGRASGNLRRLFEALGIGPRRGKAA